jgi:hypothetical protein
MRTSTDPRIGSALGRRDTGEREAARFTKGDIISVQIGTYDVSRAASPHAPGWSRYSAL